MEDRAKVDTIISRAFPKGKPTRGERALEATLGDGLIPDRTDWLALPADQDAGREFAEVYLLAGRALYRVRASDEPGSEGPSECWCDLLPIGTDARFSLGVVHRFEEHPGREPIPQTMIAWRFDLGADVTIEVETSTEDEQARFPEREKFARALASAIAETRVDREDRGGAS
jgi:hypothetical protein